MNKQRIVAIHLLNDFSGSPFVLSQSLATLAKADYQVELFTATPGGKGFLSDIDGVKEHSLYYRWNKNRYITLILFLRSQLSLFFRLCFFIDKADIVYINSLLPFGAALAAKLRGCKVLYHIHEVSVKPALLKKFLLFIADKTADNAIFVSNDLRQRTAFTAAASVVHNALPEAFIQTALQSSRRKSGSKFTVLMLCSMKLYKGVMEFIECANRLSSFQFNLVLNTTEEEIDQFFATVKLPVNVAIFSSQNIVHPFYREADVVVNLSRPDQWIETFGMTILEAMYYKKPVIVPPVGGVIELVTDGEEGYLVDSRDVDKVCKKLKLLSDMPRVYALQSEHAYRKAQEFTPMQFSKHILETIKTISNKEIVLKDMSDKAFSQLSHVSVREKIP